MVKIFVMCGPWTDELFCDINVIITSATRSCDRSCLLVCSFVSFVNVRPLSQSELVVGGGREGELT